jgi:hypothetical protein
VISFRWSMSRLRNCADNFLGVMAQSEFGPGTVGRPGVSYGAAFNTEHPAHIVRPLVRCTIASALVVRALASVKGRHGAGSAKCPLRSEASRHPGVGALSLVPLMPI